MSERNFPKQVSLVEVGPRDGLQNEAKMIPTDIKIDFINQLSQTGLKNIEATSFVSPQWVPQMADHAEVMQQMIRKPGITYSALVPNEKGLANAIQSKVDKVAVFTTASDTFAKKNTNTSLKDSVLQTCQLIRTCQQHNRPTRAYISCAWYCPYEGKIASDVVSDIAKTLSEAGCKEIVISDTIGKATAGFVYDRLKALEAIIPPEHLAVHFHNTYGQALANIYASLELGIHIIDTSISGLGGCPYAKGAGGNVATEDVWYLLNEMGIETGIDIRKLLKASVFINSYLQRQPDSKIAKALITEV